jgi:hypothetical protein
MPSGLIGVWRVDVEQRAGSGVSRGGGKVPNTQLCYTEDRRDFPQVVDGRHEKSGAGTDWYVELTVLVDSVDAVEAHAIEEEKLS